MKTDIQNDDLNLLSTPSKSVEEFVAKQVYISERLHQQPPATKSRVLLWCLLASLLTAALLFGAMYLYSEMDSHRLKERVQSAAGNPVAQIEEEAAAASASAQAPTPKHDN
jgi:hypothetical protein